MKSEFAEKFYKTVTFIIAMEYNAPSIELLRKCLRNDYDDMFLRHQNFVIVHKNYRISIFNVLVCFEGLKILRVQMMETHLHVNDPELNLDAEQIEIRIKGNTNKFLLHDDVHTRRMVDEHGYRQSVEELEKRSWYPRRLYFCNSIKCLKIKQSSTSVRYD